MPHPMSAEMRRLADARERRWQSNYDAGGAAARADCGQFNAVANELDQLHADRSILAAEVRSPQPGHWDRTKLNGALDRAEKE